MDIAQAYIQILPTTDGIEGNLTQALSVAGDAAGSAAGASAGGKFSSALGVATKIGVGAIGAVATGVTAVSASFAKSAGDVAAYGDNIDKMSQKMGMSAEAYQEWDAIMQHSGTSITAMQGSMKTLSAQAEKGSDAFDKLGLSQDQVANMSKEDLFSAVITGLQNMEEGTERTYIASQLLGRGATELGALLNTSAEDTEAMRQRVHELGGVMSDDAVKASAAYQDSLQDMQTSFGGLKNNLMIEFLPSITTAMDGVTELFSGDSEKGLAMIGSGIDDMITNVTAKFPKILETGASIVQSILTAIVNNLPKIISAGTDIVVKLAQGIIDSLPQILSAGVAAITTMVSGIGQALPDLIPAAVDAVMEFADSLIDNMPKLIEAAVQLMIGLGQGLIKAIPKIIARLPEIITSIVTALVKSAPKIAEAGLTLFTSLVKDLPKALVTIKNAVGNIIKNILGVLGNAVSSMVTAGANLLAGLGRGIIGGVKNVIESAKNAASSVVGAIKGFFGIASPSKVFAGIGGYLMDGLANGIESNERSPLSALSTLSKDMSDALTPDTSITMAMSGTRLYSAAATPQTANAGGIAYGQQQGRELTVILELDRTQFGKAVYRLNNEEVQRVGLRLAGGYA